jgi:hypothetical protein
MKLVNIIATLTVLLVPRAFAQTLLTQTDVSYIFSLYGITNSLCLTIDVGPAPALLFDGLFVHTGDVGHTFSINQSNDPDFATFVTQVTDGVPDLFGHTLHILNVTLGISPMTELQFFDSLPPGNNGVDLGGFAIDHVSLRFDSLEFVSPGSDPNGDGIWTEGSFSATFSVYGQPVPEPNSLAILSLGVVALWLRSKRRRSAER